MHFKYTVTASGHGFYRFIVHFNGQEFLSLEQIKFLTFCKMQDSGSFNEKGGELKLIEISIKGE